MRVIKLLLLSSFANLSRSSSSGGMSPFHRPCEKIFIDDLEATMRASTMQALSELYDVAESETCDAKTLSDALSSTFKDIDEVRVSAAEMIVDEFGEHEQRQSIAQQAVFLDTIKTVTRGWITGIYFSSDLGTRIASVMENFHLWTKSMLSMRMHLVSKFETEYRLEVFGVSKTGTVDYRDFLRQGVRYMLLGFEEEFDRIVEKSWLSVALWVARIDDLKQMLDTANVQIALHDTLADEMRRILHVMDLLDAFLLNNGDETEREEQAELELKCHIEPSEILLQMLKETSLNILDGTRRGNGLRGAYSRPFTAALRSINPEIEKYVSEKFALNEAGRSRTSSTEDISATDCESIVDALSPSSRCNLKCVERFVHWRTRFLTPALKGKKKIDVDGRARTVECVSEKLRKMATIPN